MAYDSFAYWGFRGKYRLLIIFNNNKDIYFKHEMFMLLYKYKTVAKIARGYHLLGLYLVLSFIPLKRG